MSKKSTIKNGVVECSLEEGLKFNIRSMLNPVVLLAQSKIRLDGRQAEISTEQVEGNLIVKAETDEMMVTINNVLDSQKDYLEQKIELEAKTDGHMAFDETGFEIMLHPMVSDSQVFIPTHWAYSGTTKNMPVIDTHCQHYTVCEGYENQIRTPAISAWDENSGITAAVTGHHLAHIKIEKKQNNDGGVSPCLFVPFDKPALAPAHYINKPYFKKGEKLKFSFFIHPHSNSWETGMKRWMKYVKENIIKDESKPVSWIKDLGRIAYINWGEISKEEVDRAADWGIKIIEGYPLSEPSSEIIDYIHSKGMKVVMESYLLCHYEINRGEACQGFKKPQKGKNAEAMTWPPVVKRITDKHPEWCLDVLPTPSHRSLRSGGPYFHMDPHEEGFRRAKVEEAVYYVKKGFDGMRYDNVMVLQGVSKDTNRSMTYAEATLLMMREIKYAIRKANPEAVIMGNNPGPDLFNILDIMMYESGVSSEQCRVDDRGNLEEESSNYKKAQARMLAAKCLWELSGIPTWIWDYPLQAGSKEMADLWIVRSIIFDMMHGAIVGMGGLGGKGNLRIKAHEMAARLTSMTKDAVSELTHFENIGVRYYKPGVLQIIETSNKPWNGKIIIPEDILSSLGFELSGKLSYTLFSEDNFNLNCAKINFSDKNVLDLELKADGIAVIEIKKGSIEEYVGKFIK